MARRSKSPRRFFAPPDRIRGGIAQLPADETHHLKNVLRVKEGSRVEVIDGAGHGYLGRVRFREDNVEVESLVPLADPRESPLQITLALSLVKAERFEWAVQKATELGVFQIVPIAASRSEVRIAEGKIEERVDRWNRISREAAKQCGRWQFPIISPPRDFMNFLQSGLFSSIDRFLLHENSEQSWDAAPVQGHRVLLCVGPEGGWDDCEVEAAAGAGFKVCRMGSRVMRTETAAVSALAIFQFRCGDLGPWQETSGSS